MNLVIDIGAYQIKAGLFEGEKLVNTHVCAKLEQLLPLLKNLKIDQALVAAKETGKAQELTALGFPCQFVEVADYDRLATDETRPLLQPDKIANIFGALYHFPLNDCVIVDMGSEIRCDFVTKQGVYLGGALFKNEFPEVGGEPPAALGKTVVDQKKSGCYFGLLGAIERMAAELRLSSPTPSGVMVVATGGRALSPAFKNDLQDFIDAVDPHLSLVGLNQILKERS